MIIAWRATDSGIMLRSNIPFSLTADDITFEIAGAVDIGMDSGDLCNVFIRLNPSIARSRRRNER